MSDPLYSYRCLLEGEMTLDSTTPVNTSGAFCDLLTATHPTAGKLALKRPRGEYDEDLVARIEIEAGVWSSLKHPRVLQFLGIHKMEDELYLVSEFAENGSLPGFLKRRPNVDRKRLVIEIAEGLAYLHQCGIIHGDLKGNNILVSGDEHVQLCDFGLAKHVTSRTSTSLRGTGSIPWQSPELLQDACKRTFGSDAYAFGITVYEVLSGKEPYSHHLGIVSIITGVVFNGERPPKEPEVALDGSSYLQFWEEASKCWAEDSSLRPRIIDVLNRLDRRRAEKLVTSQQRLLEDSLILPTDGMPSSQFSSVPELPPLPSDGASKQDTLDWAHRIRVRMNHLVNSQRPVYRIPPKLIVKIVEYDLGERTWRYSPNWRSDDHSCKDSYVRHVERCAELGTVCRAWREAIENTPELTECIMVNGPKKNIKYVERCNRDGPLELFMSYGGSPTWSSLHSLLGPLAHRLRSLNTCSTNLSFESLPFAMLRVVRVQWLWAPGTFVAELLRMLHANQDLTELILDQITIQGSDSGVGDWSRLRIDHSGLQRVQLTRLSPRLRAHILHCLGLKNSVILNVDQLSQEDLGSPDSAFGNLIRSLGRTQLLVAPGVEVTPAEVEFDVGQQMSDVKFNYAVQDHALPHGGQSPRSEATSEWSQLTWRGLFEQGTVDMIRVLQDLGIQLEYARLGSHGSLLANLLRELSHITRLTLHIDLAVLDKLGQPLQRDPQSPDECLQYLCPNLKIMDLKRPAWRIVSSQDGYNHLYRMVQNRQTETRPTNGLVKLQKIALPDDRYMKHDFSGPVFEGIEIYSRGR